MDAVSRAVVSVLGHDAHDCHRVRPDGERPRHMKHHRGIVRGLRAIQHGEIVDRAGLFDRVVGERHVLRCQLLAVGEICVVPDGHRPCQTVLADRIVRCKIIADGQIGVCDRERGLDERLVYMLARPPAERRIKARLRLRGRPHCHNDGIGLRCGLLLRILRIRTSAAARKRAHSHGRTQQQSAPPLSFSREISHCARSPQSRADTKRRAFLQSPQRPHIPA